MPDAVRAVISLDANVVPARPEETMVLRRPLVYFIGQDTTGRGFASMDTLPGPWITIRALQLAHGNFNALEGYLPARFEADTVFAWSLGGEVARVGYQALVRMVTTTVSAFTADPTPTMRDLAVRLSGAAGNFPLELRLRGSRDSTLSGVQPRTLGTSDALEAFRSDRDGVIAKGDLLNLHRSLVKGVRGSHRMEGQFRRGGVVAVEVKASNRVTTGYAKHLRVFLDEYRDLARGGLILYSGDRVQRISREILAAPWRLVV